jgi:hypothetical protein
LSAIRISPSAGGHERAVAQRQVDAAVGDADVVEEGIDLLRRDVALDHLFDAREDALGLLDSGARRARTWSRIWPASTVGKKSLPINPKPTRHTELPTRAANAQKTAGRCPRPHARSPP